MCAGPSALICAAALVDQAVCLQQAPPSGDGAPLPRQEQPGFSFLLAKRVPEPDLHLTMCEKVSA